MGLTAIVAVALLVGVCIGVLTYVLGSLERASVRECLDAGISHSEHGFVSGGKGQDYYDLDEASADPKISSRLADQYESMISELILERGPVDRLVFIEKKVGPVGAVTLRDVLSQKTDIPALIARPRRRLAASAIKGDFTPGDKVILVTDVITKGTTVLDPIQKLERLGRLQVVGVVAFLLRTPTIEAELSEKGIALKYPADWELLKQAVGRSRN
jgi:orotate phosphoribosyltransferase